MQCRRLGPLCRALANHDAPPPDMRRYHRSNGTVRGQQPDQTLYDTGGICASMRGENPVLACHACLHVSFGVCSLCVIEACFSTVLVFAKANHWLRVASVFYHIASCFSRLYESLGREPGTARCKLVTPSGLPMDYELHVGN